VHLPFPTSPRSAWTGALQTSTSQWPCGLQEVSLIFDLAEGDTHARAGNGKLPWMSMLRACDQPFVGYEVVPSTVSEELKVEFPDSAADFAAGAPSNAQGADDKGDVVL
jgi:hypothetical protein